MKDYGFCFTKLLFSLCRVFMSNSTQSCKLNSILKNNLFLIIPGNHNMFYFVNRGPLFYLKSPLHFMAHLSESPACDSKSAKQGYEQTSGNFPFPFVCLHSLPSFHSSPESAIGRDVHSQKATEVPGRVALYARTPKWIFRRTSAFSKADAIFNTQSINRGEESTAQSVSVSLFASSSASAGRCDCILNLSQRIQRPWGSNTNTTRALHKKKQVSAAKCANADIKGLDTNKTLCRSQYLRHFYPALSAPQINNSLAPAMATACK